MSCSGKLFLFFAVCLLCSCEEDISDNSSPGAVISPDTAITSTPAPMPVTDTVISAASGNDSMPACLRDWERERRSKGIPLHLDNFFTYGISTFSLGEYGSWDELVGNDYSRSPDGRYYAHHLPGWPDGDADTYVYLIDIKKSKEYIVSVLGTCCSYDGTCWKDAHTLIACGYDSEGAEMTYPGHYLAQGFYQEFDLSTNSCTGHASRNYIKRPCFCGPSSP